MTLGKRGALASGLRRRLPRRARTVARGLASHLPSRLLELTGAPPTRARWGNLRRTTPFSTSFGFDRGTPVDRHFIEDFLATHRSDIRGDCLEVLNDDYTRRYGQERVERADVLDVDAANARADVFADLGVPESLPASSYDCFVLTQTIHYLADPQVGIDNAWTALRPGGTLLLTVPSIQRFVDWRTVSTDRWRFGPAAVQDLLGDGWCDVDVQTYGNLTTAVASLLGLSHEELRPADLKPVDPSYPLLIAARAVKTER